MKKLFYEINYEKIICSACPFSTGVKNMAGTIPCGKINGMIYRLQPPYKCGMLEFGQWTEEELYKEIRKKGGEAAITRFKIKQAGIKALFDRETEPIET